MARKSFAEQQLPSRGADATPYPDHREIASKYLAHGTDTYVGEVTGAGGVGGVLSGIPFQPAIVEIFDTTVPLAQKQVPGSAGAVDVNLITGAAAAHALAVASDDATVPSWKVTLDVNLAPNGHVVHVVCYGFPDRGGSL